MYFMEFLYNEGVIFLLISYCVDFNEDCLQIWEYCVVTGIENFSVVC